MRCWTAEQRGVGSNGQWLNCRHSMGWLITNHWLQKDRFGHLSYTHPTHNSHAHTGKEVQMITIIVIWGGFKVGSCIHTWSVPNPPTVEHYYVGLLIVGVVKSANCVSLKCVAATATGLVDWLLDCNWFNYDCVNWFLIRATLLFFIRRINWIWQRILTNELCLWMVSTNEFIILWE